MVQKLTNEEVARIFAMYWGCRAIVGYGKKRYTLCGIKPMDFILKGTQGSMVYRSYETIKLLLKPLPSISDEDAIEIARLGLYEGNEPAKVGKDIVDRVMNYTKYNHPRMCLSYEQGDYLRSKGYELPYKGQSLFDLGIAIDATKTDKS